MIANPFGERWLENNDNVLGVVEHGPSSRDLFSPSVKGKSMN